jgi:uncharacterized protein YndB with AHSA1/START domain
MTTTAREIAAPRESVWAVLADARSYDQWVVGAKEIRAADAGWPAPGTRFHHSVGWGPLSLQDNTKSLEAEAPHRLVMEARARPLGRARVELVLDGHEGATRVTMEETVVSPALLRWCRPLLAPLVQLRNAESLRRLDELTVRVDATVPPGRA